MMLSHGVEVVQDGMESWVNRSITSWQRRRHHARDYVPRVVHTESSGLECRVKTFLGGGRQGEVYWPMLRGQEHLEVEDRLHIRMPTDAEPIEIPGFTIRAIGDPTTH